VGIALRSAEVSSMGKIAARMSLKAQ